MEVDDADAVALPVHRVERELRGHHQREHQPPVQSHADAHQQTGDHEHCTHATSANDQRSLRRTAVQLLVSSGQTSLNIFVFTSS